MAKRKLDTMKLSGNEYAKVAIRVKAFREENPRGSIVTEQEFLTNNLVRFKTTVVKDKADIHSADATGTALLILKMDGLFGPKEFEKHETISVGRALANLGYLINGEVASSEEMEDFLTEKEAKRQDKIEWLREQVALINDLPTLKEFTLKNASGLGNDAVKIATERAQEIKAAATKEAK